MRKSSRLTLASTATTWSDWVRQLLDAVGIEPPLGRVPGATVEDVIDTCVAA